MSRLISLNIFHAAYGLLSGTLVGCGLLALLSALTGLPAFAQSNRNPVPKAEMQRVYEEIRTPHKYGLVLVPEDTSRRIDSPTIFRKDSVWYMSYIVFDGRGYETWLASSLNLLDWTTQGRILSFSGPEAWDGSQAAGYPALVDTEWGGDYALQSHSGKYWMSYLGGNTQGYEAGLLSVGMAYTEASPEVPHEWRRQPEPVLMATDEDAGYWENITLYKSTVIRDTARTTGYPFVMYYNAQGDTLSPPRWIERIGLATSDDLVHWQRYEYNPVLDHHRGITGDAYLQRMGDLWVMFYFGAFWPEGRTDAFNRFACSYDLVHWTDWEGEDLIRPSEPYDARYAHKPCVIRWQGVVYHFYNAVDRQEQRGIALATSRDLGNSQLQFARPSRPARK